MLPIHKSNILPKIRPRHRNPPNHIPSRCKTTRGSAQNEAGPAAVSEWHSTKQSKMEGILFHKFDQNPDLAERLISTGEKFLVEASHSERFWGAGATIDDIRQWHFTGRNTMGQLLMELREKLREYLLTATLSMPKRQSKPWIPKTKCPRLLPTTSLEESLQALTTSADSTITPATSPTEPADSFDPLSHSVVPSSPLSSMETLLALISVSSPSENQNLPKNSPAPSPPRTENQPMPSSSEPDIIFLEEISPPKIPENAPLAKVKFENVNPLNWDEIMEAANAISDSPIPSPKYNVSHAPFPIAQSQQSQETVDHIPQQSPSSQVPVTQNPQMQNSEQEITILEPETPSRIVKYQIAQSFPFTIAAKVSQGLGHAEKWPNYLISDPIQGKDLLNGDCIFFSSFVVVPPSHPIISSPLSTIPTLKAFHKGINPQLYGCQYPLNLVQGIAVGHKIFKTSQGVRLNIYVKQIALGTQISEFYTLPQNFPTNNLPASSGDNNFAISMDSTSPPRDLLIRQSLKPFLFLF
ncbi:hypothetical protein niasHT_014838 [Heterodera trifolii]|uniref:NADAR domain-containing protein n=1 Tax=Heterodera trifolii TaxID=157864 RepID=A0ABD2L6U5_9BILA